MSLYTGMLKPVRRFCADEKGAYAVSFVMLSSFLLGMAAFGLEGSRYITERARLSDAMEQAALALTAEDNGPGAARNETLAQDYFRAYMRHDIAVFKPKIIVNRGSSPNNSNLSYVEYRVSGQTLQNSWFSSSFFPSFDKQVTIGDNGAARKYHSNIDVIFVTDFSGSMNSKFDGKVKLIELKRIVLKLSAELFSQNINNKVGFIPFGWGGQVGSYCDLPFVTHAPWPEDKTFSSADLVDIDTNYVNINATVASIPRRVNDLRIPLKNVKGTSPCLITVSTKKVPLTSSMSDIQQIQGMTAFGNTLVSSGMLMGTPYLTEGTASRKVMVVVSDGWDAPEEVMITPRLINAGMCDKIRQVISTKESVGKIAYIAIGYRPTTDWTRCVGKKNFYLPENLKELEDDLRRAVFEEVGHNVIKD